MENNNFEKEIPKLNEEQQKKEGNLSFIFFHKIREKLGHASGANYMIDILRTRGITLGKDESGQPILINIEDEKEKENIIKDKLEIVEASKQLFRDFLETIIDGRQPTPNSLLFTKNRMREAYEKSNFDWSDQKKITEFGTWLFDEKDEPKVEEVSF